jgi:uncharacterized membrane protein
MTKKITTQVVVAAFHEEATAAQIADALKEAKKHNQLSYRNVVVIRKDETGNVKVKETRDMSPGLGAGIGAIVGGAFGLLAGPAGFAADSTSGVALGGTSAALIDSGFDDKRLLQIGDVLQPGNSAIIAVFEEVEVDRTTREEVDQDLSQVITNLPADISHALQGGQDVAYAFAVTEDGIVASRMATGDDAADIQGLVAGQESVPIRQAVAIEDGVAYEIAAAAQYEVAYEADLAINEGAVWVNTHAVPTYFEDTVVEEVDALAYFIV